MRMTRLYMAAATAVLLIGAVPNASADELGDLRNSVSKIFETNCARCHQLGKLAPGRDNPAKNFGNILDLPALVADAKHLQPGIPDNSILWKLMLNKSMPYELQSDPLFDGPSDEDIETVANWIKAEGAAIETAKKSRPFVSDQDIIAAIVDDIEELRKERVKSTRYLTFSHFWNSGVPDQEIEVFRQGTVKLLNSLSSESDPVRYEKLGPQGLIVRLNLDDLGWSADDWRLVVAATPFAIDYDSVGFEFVGEATGEDIPFLRADVFAFEATQPGLYHELARIPATVLELEKRLGVDAERDIKDFRIARAGFQKSGVSRNNRMIERHASITGGYWRSYDFAGNAKSKSLFLSPTGPGGKGGFEPDGGEYIFALPNGMQAYMLANGKGDRIEFGPANVVADPSRRDNAVANGVSCMGCHADGMIDRTKDEMRAYVLADKKFSREVRETIEATHPEISAMDALMKTDRDRFKGAMRAAGLDPALSAAGGIEPILALVLQHERNLTLSMAAAELGLSVEQFERDAPSAGTEAFALLQRLRGDQVPRDQFEAEFADLVPQITNHRAFLGRYATAPKPDYVEPQELAGQAGKKPAATLAEPFDLAIVADKKSYRVSDSPVLTITSSADCYLTVISVDLNGKAVLLAPNPFEPDAVALKAGKALIFPDPKAEYEMVLKDPGEEKVTAICNRDEPRVAGVDYDFSKGGFVDQGSETELNRAISREVGLRRRKHTDTSSSPASGQGEVRKSAVLKVGK